MAEELLDNIKDEDFLCISCRKRKKDCIMTTITINAKSSKQVIDVYIEGFICNECTVDAGEEAAEMVLDLNNMGAKTSLNMKSV